MFGAIAGGIGSAFAGRALSKLFGTRRADDSSGYFRTLQHPCHGNLGQRLAAFLEERMQLRGYLQVFGMPVAFPVERTGSSTECEARAGRRLLLLSSVLPCKQTPGQWIERDHSDALVAAQRQQFQLDVACQHVVPRLYAVEACPSMMFGGPQRQCQQPS